MLTAVLFPHVPKNIFFLNIGLFLLSLDRCPSLSLRESLAVVSIRTRGVIVANTSQAG
jgi:hypothetical protein